MQEKLTRQALFLLAPGFYVQLIGVAAIDSRYPGPLAMVTTSTPPTWAVMLVCVSAVLMMAGLSLLARAKARSGWWALAALAGLPGALIVAILPDQSPASDLAPPMRNPLAGWSLALALLGLIPLAGAAFAGAGAVLGGMALKRCERNPALAGRPAAFAAVVLGILFVVSWLTVWLMLAVGVLTALS